MGSNHDAMIALLRASLKVRDGRWIRGAPTHVLAEFLTELEKAGWVLVRQEDHEDTVPYGPTYRD